MKYDLFKKARGFAKNEANKEMLGKINECEEMLSVLEKVKAGNTNSEGKQRYKATITINIHGRDEEDASGKDVRSLSYDTNFDFVEKKVRGEYDKLLKDFEERYGE